MYLQVLLYMVAGLFAYGPDENNRVDFDVMTPASYLETVNRLESHLHEYSPIPQFSNPHKYIDCSVFAGQPLNIVPEKDKVCMQTTGEFGTKCQNENLYGLPQRPCILLVLKLEEGFVPKPFNFSNGESADVERALDGRISNTSIGVSCSGKTQADSDHMQLKMLNKTGATMPLNSGNGPQIDYNPGTGFPVYYFVQPERDSGYINPAVMVQFNTIPVNTEVTVQCTAWAQNFNNGKPQESTKFTVEFTFNIHH